MNTQKKTKKELEEEIQILNRLTFLKVYEEFNDWLNLIGFKPGHYWNDCTTAMDCHYSHYDKHIDSLFGVECYVHDILDFKIRFLRDRNEHKFIMVLGLMGTHSETVSLEEMKKVIFAQVSNLKEEKLEMLNSIKI